MPLKIRFRTLSSRIVILTLTIIIGFSLITGFTVYQITASRINTFVENKLESLATAKRLAVEIEIKRYEEVLRSFVLPDLELIVESLLAAPEGDKETVRQQLVDVMERKMMASTNYVAVQILDRDTNVLAKAGAADMPILGVEDDLFFQSALLRPTIAKPYFMGGELLINLAIYLKNSQNNIQGIMVMRKQARNLQSISGEYSGLGRTGETVMGIRQGDFVSFLTPLRFVTNVDQMEPYPVSGDKALPMIYATAGQNGLVHSIDYLGAEVIAAYQHVNSPIVSNWGIVVKINYEEAFIEMAELRNTLLILFVTLIGIAAAFVFPLSATLTKPLADLESATEQIAQGNLKVNVPVGRADEVGRLGESFNLMVMRLQEVQNELIRSNEDLSSFAYVVSHDLKAPLRGISSLTTWLSEDLAKHLEGDQMKQMELLQNRVGRMDALINGLLEYSKVGRVINPVVMTRVEDLVLRVIDFLNPPDNLEITVEAPLPVLMTDDLRLSQVFQNLIGNAISYHPGPDGEIVVGCRDAGDFWEFFVSDDGDGIEPRFHGRIFAMFQSLQYRDDIDSTGIGLALVKKIVIDNGGDVRIESDGVQGKGAIFRFTWPKNMTEA